MESQMYVCVDGQGREKNADMMVVEWEWGVVNSEVRKK